jgi:hypothetical protein
MAMAADPTRNCVSHFNFDAHERHGEITAGTQVERIERAEQPIWARDYRCLFTTRTWGCRDGYQALMVWIATYSWRNCCVRLAATLIDVVSASDDALAN